MTDKYIISSEQQLHYAFRLGALVLKSGFRPNLIVAIWRGGAPIGIAVQELFAAFGVETDHIAIRTQSYTGIDQRSEVKVFGLGYLVKNVRHSDRLLIVDDVFDTGHTIQAVIGELRARARLNTPEDIRVAVPWYKPANNQVGREPEYYLEATDKWLNLPHSLTDLTVDEIKKHRPQSWEIIAPLVTSTRS